MVFSFITKPLVNKNNFFYRYEPQNSVFTLEVIHEIIVEHWITMQDR